MALEPIDYTTHCREIEEVFQKVVRGSDAEIEWLVLSPNSKKEYTAESVGSGFSEFLGTFEDTKVQFGLARVSPPGSDVQKLILIGWCPDSAPLKTRASFASNFGVVANQVLKSYHVQVTARDEDDLDENELLMKISNAAGARYSIQQEPTRTSSAPKPRPAATPKATPSSNNVSTAPKPSADFTPKPSTTASVPKAAPASAPKPAAQFSTPVSGRDAGRSNSSGEDDDWDEPEIEERDFDSKPLKPNKSSWQPVGKVDLQKLIAEENAKQDPRLVNMVKSDTPVKLNPQDDIQKLKQESRAQRDAELNKFMGTKPPTGSVPKKDDDKVIRGFQNEKSPAQLWAEKHQQKVTSPQKASAATEAAEGKKEDEDDEEEEAPEVSNVKAKFEKMAVNEPTIIKPGQPKTPAPVESYSAPAPPKASLGRPLPGMHTELDDDQDANSSNAQDDDDDWDDQSDEEVKPPAPAPRPSLPARTSTATSSSPAPAPGPRPQSNLTQEVPTKTQVDEKPAAAAAPSLPTRTSESSYVPPPPPRRNVPVTEEPEEPEEPETVEGSQKNAAEDELQLEEKLPSAIAEYDNEAEEHNELAFEEGDKIINISFVDDDWWLGELEKTGEKGLFPSNYVQLIK